MKSTDKIILAESLSRAEAAAELAVRAAGDAAFAARRAKADAYRAERARRPLPRPASFEVDTVTVPREYLEALKARIAAAEELEARAVEAASALGMVGGIVGLRTDHIGWSSDATSALGSAIGEFRHTRAAVEATRRPVSCDH